MKRVTLRNCVRTGGNRLAAIVSRRPRSRVSARVDLENRNPQPGCGTRDPAVEARPPAASTPKPTERLHP